MTLLNAKVRSLLPGGRTCVVYIALDETELFEG